MQTENLDNPNINKARGPVTADLGFITIDAGNHVCFINNQARIIFSGFNLPAAGEDISPFLSEAVPGLAEAISFTRTSCLPSTYEYLAESGKCLHFQIIPFENSGTGPGIHLIAEDITEKKSVEQKNKKIQQERAEELLEINTRLTQEIIERKKIEYALRKSEQQLRLIADAMPAHISYVDADQVYRFVNKKYTEWFTLETEEIIGKKVIEVLGETAYRTVQPFIESALSGKYTVYETEINYEKLGRRYIRGAYIPHISEEGTINGYFVMVEDLTEHKNIEKRLEDQNRELERSNHELESFAYIASHDLQEPLRMIASYVQLLEKKYRGRLDDEAEEFIGFVVNGVKRMKMMIQGLLDYSRISTRGKEFREADLNQIFSLALSNLGLSVSETGAEISCEALPVLKVDSGQMLQLFQNLLNNAIKYRSQSPPVIKVKAVRQENRWLFSVSDNGIGINNDYKERIFIIFQRLHTSFDYPGDGLGLAICKKIVERHGGTIWAESEPGSGSTFFFTLPG